MVTEGLNYNVFISYEASTGSSYAANVCEALKHAGYSVFFDQRTMPPAKDWREHVKMVLGNCSYFICIITTHASLSENVLAELELAMELEEQESLDIILCRHQGISDERLERALQESNGRVRARLLMGSELRFTSEGDLATRVVNHLAVFQPVSPVSADEAVESLLQVGIVKVFENRRKDGDAIAKEIRDQIEESSEILMMGNSLRDYFGYARLSPNNEEPRFKEHIEESLERRRPPKYRLILLNPLSQAAKERAVVENGLEVRDDGEYLKCGVFVDAYNTTQYVKEKIKEGKDFRIKFSSITPTFYMIRTKDFTFVESYHMGRLCDVGINTQDKDSHVVCIGGYTPVFKLKNGSTFADFLKSHFENIWLEAEELPVVDHDFEHFRKDPAEFRRRQFLDECIRKGKYLVDRDWLRAEVRGLI